MAKNGLKAKEDDSHTGFPPCRKKSWGQNWGQGLKNGDKLLPIFTKGILIENQLLQRFASWHKMDK